MARTLPPRDADVMLRAQIRALERSVVLTRAQERRRAYQRIYHAKYKAVRAYRKAQELRAERRRIREQRAKTRIFRLLGRVAREMAERERAWLLELRAEEVAVEKAEKHAIQARREAMRLQKQRAKALARAEARKRVLALPIQLQG